MRQLREIIYDNLKEFNKKKYFIVKGWKIEDFYDFISVGK